MNEKPTPVVFSNVTMVRTRGLEVSAVAGVTARLAEDNSGDFFVQTADGKMKAFIQPETMDLLLKGNPVKIEI